MQVRCVIFREDGSVVPEGGTVTNGSVVMCQLLATMELGDPVSQVIAAVIRPPSTDKGFWYTYTEIGGLQIGLETMIQCFDKRMHEVGTTTFTGSCLGPGNLGVLAVQSWQVV